MEYIRLYGFGMNGLNNATDCKAIVSVCIYRSQANLAITTNNIASTLNLSWKKVDTVLKYCRKFNLLDDTNKPTELLTKQILEQYVKLYPVTDNFTSNVVWSYLYSFSATKSPVTNSGIARVTGLHRQTVTTKIDELVKLKLVEPPHRNINGVFYPQCNLPESTVGSEPKAKPEPKVAEPQPEPQPEKPSYSQRHKAEVQAMQSEERQACLEYKRIANDLDLIQPEAFGGKCWQIFGTNVSNCHDLIKWCAEKSKQNRYSRKQFAKLVEAMVNKKHNELATRNMNYIPPLAESKVGGMAVAESGLSLADRIRIEMNRTLELVVKDESKRNQVIAAATAAKLPAPELAKLVAVETKDRANATPLAERLVSRLSAGV